VNIRASLSNIVRVTVPAVLLGLAGIVPLRAQQVGEIVGRVTGPGGLGVAGAAVEIVQLDRTEATGEEGTFRFDRVPEGTFRVRVTHLGYATHEERVSVRAGATARVDFELSPRPIALQGVKVTVVRPDLIPESTLEGDQLDEANPRDPGELVRALAGVDAVRRGPIGLDPSVRGLRETEVGAYVDGQRTFPAGPARMDSQLGHVDPSAIRKIEVIKGPYALTWGAGNLSAIRVETQEVPPLAPGALHGTLSTGYDGNLDAVETSASLFGRSGGVSYWALGAWRDGNDYESGDGQVVPADFRSWEGRGKLGLEIGDSGLLTLGAGHQEQDDIDYPGRILNALFFHTTTGSAELELRPSPEGTLRSLDLLAYVGHVDHNMTNAGKPTAEPNPNRTPPFALDVDVVTASTTLGGRAAVELAPSPLWSVEIGGDAYSVNRDAQRTVARQDNQMTLFEDQVWPDVTITDVGTFVRASRRVGSSVQAALTGRVDFVAADAGTPSDFFLQNVSDDLDQSETNLSGAFTLGVDLDEHWTLSAGVGSAVRTADALERYSDRFPASKAQIAAEFVGNPALEPERSTQVDVWLEADFPRVSLDLNAFNRWMANYITLALSDLPKRLPLSPDQVYEYVNGEATFRGFEASAAVRVTDEVSVRGSAQYLWGQDETLDEPALGVSPFTSALTLRYDHPGRRFYVEGGVQGVARQDRLATQRGETQATDGYVLADLQAGIRLLDRLELRGGALNLFDQEYVNHLNSKNPFTGAQIPEPGRVLFVDLSIAF